MLVLQDKVVGNQQKRQTVFWKRVAEDYNENRPNGVRPLRSLKTKWSIIKDNLSKFYGIYSHVQRLHKLGSNARDTLRHVRDLYRQKSAKKLTLDSNIARCC